MLLEATVEELTSSESPTTRGKTRWRRICRRSVHLFLRPHFFTFERLYLDPTVLLPGGLCAVKPEGNVPSHGRGDRETKQAAGQDWRQDGRRRRQHRQGQREDTETAEVDYSDAQSNSSYHAHYLKDSRICWLGLLRKLWLLNVYMSKLSCL